MFFKSHKWENASLYPPKTNMTMENPPFEDVFPSEHGDFECHVTFQGLYPLQNSGVTGVQFQAWTSGTPKFHHHSFPTQMKRRVRGPGAKDFFFQLDSLRSNQYTLPETNIAP